MEVPVPVKRARVAVESTAAAAALETTADRSTTVALEPTVNSRSTTMAAVATVATPSVRIPGGGESQRECEQDGEGCADVLHALETLQGVGHILGFIGFRAGFWRDSRARL